jgi:hypothetical protein
MACVSWNGHFPERLQMIDAALTETGSLVAKTRKPRPSGDEFGRIELQAPVVWIAELDAAAEKLGLSRSAFIRLACHRLMQAERRNDASD